MELDKNVLRIIASETDVPIEEITGDTDLFDDLDFDSLDLINIIQNFEDINGLRIELNDFSECRTVKDISDRFQELSAESIPLS
mgnify:CR=1 FL=1